MNGAKITIKNEDCKACKLCVNACFVDVLHWDAANKRPVIAYPEDCVWCLACEMECPAQCISVTPNVPIGIVSPF